MTTHVVGHDESVMDVAKGSGDGVKTLSDSPYRTC